MKTQIFLTGRNQSKAMRLSLIRIWPSLRWRHAGFGAIQSYIAEGMESELRVHIWHHSLIKPGIEESGLCHDHRFDMCSMVLAGCIHQTEFEIDERPGGGLVPRGLYQTWEVTHARAAMGKVGSHHIDPTPTGRFYERAARSLEIVAGNYYTFPKYCFHETRFEGVTVTLVTKNNQDETRARILAPSHLPIVHAFANPNSVEEISAVAEMGLGAIS